MPSSVPVPHAAPSGRHGRGVTYRVERTRGQLPGSTPENMRSRFALATGLSSQGFSDGCELPIATTPSQPG